MQNSTLPRIESSEVPSVQKEEPKQEVIADVPEEYVEREISTEERLQIIEMRLNAIEAALLRIRGAI